MSGNKELYSGEECKGMATRIKAMNDMNKKMINKEYQQLKKYKKVLEKILNLLSETDYINLNVVSKTLDTLLYATIDESIKILEIEMDRLLDLI